MYHFPSLHIYIFSVYSWQCAVFPHILWKTEVQFTNSCWNLNKEHLNNMTEKCLEEKVSQVSVGECVRKLIKSFITSSVWESGPLWATGPCDRIWVIGSLSFSERGASVLTESCMRRGHTDRQDIRKECEDGGEIKRPAEWRRDGSQTESRDRELNGMQSLFR